MRPMFTLERVSFIYSNYFLLTCNFFASDKKSWQWNRLLVYRIRNYVEVSRLTAVKYILAITSVGDVAP